ncbi:response regulator transcription factor [Magnetococcus sp. PR-3]|uniref:response regulator transcription factor n=1 Tax=Magnetococcus sp. PR-3 TaxID=3120355 RepID=UPI002FCE11B6
MNKPLKAVVVDDDANMRSLVMSLLEAQGVIVVAEGEDGGDAAILYDQHHPDFMLLDYHMPTMSGLDALNQVMNAGSDRIVIMLSSVPGPRNSVVDDCLVAGAMDWIRKDLGPQEMEAQLQGTLAKLFG